MKGILRNRYLWYLGIIFLIAIAIRVVFFIGFGLSDDPIYAGVVNNIMKGGFRALDLRYGVNYRIGLYLPILLFFSLFGVNDISFVLYTLLASLGSIIVIYFIGKELFGREVGLIASLLLAFCPFDAVFASTMTIDIITSFFVALGVLFFLKGDACAGKKYVLYFILSAVFLFYGYLIKIPSYFIMCCLGIITLIKIKSLRRHLIFYGSTAALLVLYFLGDRILSGHFFNCWHLELTQCAQPSWYLSILLEYPCWMFDRMWDGSMLFGYYYYLAFPAMIYMANTRLKHAYPVLLWFVVLFLIMEFIPMRFELPYKPSPRFPRYLHALIIPAIVVLAAGFYELAKCKRKIFIATLTVFLISSVVEAYILFKTWKEPFTDVNEASKFLLTLPEKPIYSDHWLLSRFKFNAQYKKDYLAPWELNGKSLQTDIIEKKDFSELQSIHNGYVVTGGSRSVDAYMNAVFNLGDYEPPQNWQLIKVIPKNPALFRHESLRIFEAK